MVSIETGSVVEWTQEENYKFRLGQYREPLLKWLSDNPKCMLSMFVASSSEVC